MLITAVPADKRIAVTERPVLAFSNRGSRGWAIAFIVFGFVVGGGAWYLRNTLTSKPFFISGAAVIAQADVEPTFVAGDGVAGTLVDGVKVYRAGSEDAEREQRFDLAVQAVNEGNWVLAESRLLEYASVYPGRAMTDYLLGFVQRRRLERDRSIESYVRFLKEARTTKSKYRFDAAVELVYLSAQVKNGCSKYATLLMPLLSAPTVDIDALGGSYAVRVGQARKAYQSCLKVESGHDRH